VSAPDVSIFCRNGHLLFSGSALSLYPGNVDFEECPHCQSKEYLTIFDWLYEEEMEYDVPKEPVDYVEKEVTYTAKIYRYDVSKVSPGKWRTFPVWSTPYPEDK